MWKRVRLTLVLGTRAASRAMKSSGDQVQRAEYETSRIDLDKTKLSIVNTHYRLYADL
jgi:hypothetical protein